MNVMKLVQRILIAVGLSDVKRSAVAIDIIKDVVTENAIGRKELYATVIGSRQTPVYQLYILKLLVKVLNTRGYIIRSGGAMGADHVATMNADLLECYMPWDKFKPFKDNKQFILETIKSNDKRKFTSFEAYDKAIVNAALYLARAFEQELVAKKQSMSKANGSQVFTYTPLEKLAKPVQKLKGRNMLQLLGSELDTVSDIVVCYTRNGSYKGGTGLNIWAAERLGIKVMNIGSSAGMKKALQILDKYKVNVLTAKEFQAAEAVRVSKMQDVAKTKSVKIVEPKPEEETEAAWDVVSEDEMNELFNL